MYLTWLDSNSWLIEIGGQKILLDPWLVGTLVFGNQEWLFKGSRKCDRQIPADIDLILLSQGLEDHAHPATLKQLDRNIPVVGSPNAAKVVQDLGYQQVKALTPGEIFNLNNSVEIKAVPGSSLGPNNVENGYLLKELETGFSLYYEPHGSHSPTLKADAPIDVVVTPIIDLALPLVGPIIKGKKSALEVAQMVKPQVMLPTAAGGNIEYDGLLVKFLKDLGTTEEFRAKLAENNLATKVLEPQPGIRFEVSLERRLTNSFAA